MTLGKLKQVNNIGRKFGAMSQYWFLKVQSEHGQEEYWLTTASERTKFQKRAANNPEDTPSARRGVFEVVENDRRRFGSDVSYFSVKVRLPGEPSELWFLTAYDLERVRQRSEKNAEDIEANRESWLADLLD